MNHLGRFNLSVPLAFVGIVGNALSLCRSRFTGLTTRQMDWPNFGLSAVGVAGMAVGMVRAARMLGRAEELADAGRMANRADELIPSGGISESTARRLPMTGVPNSMVRQLDKTGKVRSLGHYDDFGRMFRRIDVSGRPHFIPGRGYTLPHVREFAWSPGGRFEGWGFRAMGARPTTYWEDFLIRIYR